MLPIKLSGDSLGERQAGLNKKVQDAFNSQVDFNAIKDLKEENDIDRFFKIDLANKYKNVEYIVETFKSGDSLYVSRALKCAWMFNDSLYNDVINPEYMKQYIFPFMSEKCIKKLFSKIAANVNEERAKVFYDFCITSGRVNLAEKFLVHCSNDVKVDEIKREGHINGDGKRICYKSFDALKVIIEDDKFAWYVKWEYAYRCRDLYNDSNEKYLDIVEMFAEYANKSNFTIGKMAPKFGKRFTKHILVENKTRVMEKPHLYLWLLHKKTLLAYLDPEEAKLWSANTFTKLSDFWRHYLSNMNDIINLIDCDARYEFVKSEFKKQFPKEEFEFNKSFLDYSYYNLMTAKQQEEWALKSMARKEEFFGSNSDFNWYKFINFDTAFVELKKLIHNATDKDRRFKMLEVLTETTSIQEDVEKLLKYFLDRHINEDKSHKIGFIITVINKHSIKIVLSCWSIFNELFHDVDLYKGSMLHGNTLLTCALSHYILKNQEIPSELIKSVMNQSINYSLMKLFLDVEREKIFEILLQHYQTETKNCQKEENKYIKCLESILRLIKCFSKNLLDYTTVIEMVKPYAARLWHYHITYDGIGKVRELREVLFKDSIPCDLTEEMLISVIKKNASHLDNYITVTHKRQLKTYRLYSKLKTYFPQDYRQTLADRYLNEIKETNKGAYTIPKLVQHYMLIESQEKVRQFMLEYKPQNSKIKRSERNSMIMIQEGICRSLHFPRPPVSIDLIMTYIKGDYVKFCIHSLAALCATLPTSLCFEFITRLIDSPVSIQKHGVRLTFSKMNLEAKNALVAQIWGKTKNVSIRKLLFESVLVEVSNESNSLLPVLKCMIAELNDNDSEEVLKKLTSIYTHFDIKEFYFTLIPVIWCALDKLSQSSEVWKRKEVIITSMHDNYELLVQNEDHKAFVSKLMNNYANEIFIQRGFLNVPRVQQSFYDAMLKLLAIYCVYCPNEETERMQTLKEIIFPNLFAMWNESFEGIYVARATFKQFVCKLVVESKKLIFSYMLDQKPKRTMPNTKTLFENLLLSVEKEIPTSNTINLVLDVKLLLVLHDLLKIPLDHPPIEYENNDGCFDQTKDLVNKFGKEFGNLLGKELLLMMERKQYFQCLLFRFADTIKEFIFSAPQLYNYHEQFTLRVAEGLIENSNNPHLYALALNIIEVGPPKDYYDEYVRVVTKIKSLDNDEVRCLYSLKFEGDNKRRKYV